MFVRKRVIFIINIMFINLSYASFPVVDNIEIIKDTVQTKEIKEYHYSLQQMDIDLKLCKCESCRAGERPLVSKPKSTSLKSSNVVSVNKSQILSSKREIKESNGSLYVVLSILSMLSSSVFAFLTLASMLVHNGAPLPYFILMSLSIAISVFSAIWARRKGASLWKVLLGVGVAALTILVLLLLFAL